MPEAPVEREHHLYTIPYKEKQNCLQWCVLGKLRNAMNFSCLGAWPSQQNILVISKVHLMPKTLSVDNSFSSRVTSSFPGGQRWLHHHILASLRSSSGAAPRSLERGQFSREEAQPTQFSCLLVSIGHYLFHAVDLIPEKDCWLKLKKQDDIGMWIIPWKFFYKEVNAKIHGWCFFLSFVARHLIKKWEIFFWVSF